YIALGCGSLFYLPEFFSASVPAAVLICVGCVLYITGAVFYALKKTNFSYRHFCFHELFLALTAFSLVAHFAAILIDARSCPCLPPSSVRVAPAGPRALPRGVHTPCSGTGTPTGIRPGRPACPPAAVLQPSHPGWAPLRKERPTAGLPRRRRPPLRSP